MQFVEFIVNIIAAIFLLLFGSSILVLVASILFPRVFQFVQYRLIGFLVASVVFIIYFLGVFLQ